MNSEGPARPRPVFLHGMWRSGSTYIWSRFRAAENTYCYYEPLNHGLGRLTRDRIARDTPEKTSANAHPALSRPYFAEYEPLIRTRGVGYFSPRFSYDLYILEDSARDEGLRRYISFLISYAEKQGRIPVLGFNASDLRIGWMKKNFHPVGVHINRHPDLIWQSCRKFAREGNYTFFTAWMTILEKNARHPLMEPLVKNLHLRSGADRIMMKPKKFYRHLLEETGDGQMRGLIACMWALSTLHALSHCDHIIDMDRGGETGYAQTLGERLGNACGLNIALSDFNPPGSIDTDMPPLPDGFAHSVRRMIAGPSSLFDGEAIGRRIGLLTPEKQDLLDGILNAPVERKNKMVGTTGIEPVTPPV